MSNSKPEGISNESLWPRCGKRHEGRCLADREGYFSCGESGNWMRYCQKEKAMRKEGNQVAPNGSDGNARKMNIFYAL